MTATVAAVFAGLTLFGGMLVNYEFNIVKIGKDLPVYIDYLIIGFLQLVIGLIALIVMWIIYVMGRNFMGVMFVCDPKKKKGK